ncbi:MAG: VanW family protein, partial [Actinomycetota bacterium]|nr:VanW family protein [Actinomycetota bacterium]
PHPDPPTEPIRRPDPTTEPIRRLDPPTPAGPVPERRARRWWAYKRVWIPALLLAACGLLYAGDLLLAGDEVPRNTTVGGVALGGLSRDAAAALLDDELTGPVSAPRAVVAGEATGSLNSGAAGISLDVDGSVAIAARQPLNPLTRLLSLFSQREVLPLLSVDEELLDGAIAEFADNTDRPAVEGAITFEGIQPVAVDPVPGLAVDRSEAASTFVDAVRADPAQRADGPIELPVDEIAATITAAEVQAALDTIAGPALAAPILVMAPAGGAATGAIVEIPVTAIAASLRFTPGSDGGLAAMIDPAALATATGELFAPLTTAPQDARFEIVDGAMTVIPSVDGTGIDMALLSQAMLEVLSQPAPRQVAAPLGASPAALTTEAANALGITEVVSTFTTNYTSSASGQNMKVVAAEVDGAIVLPGDTFSLNDFTGPRTEAEGYVPAGVIINGEFQTAVGGGVSQFATTTFNAVFFAGLEDVYHKPHSYYISRYPAGREATVFYDSVDLVFRNDQPTGIYIQTAWSPNSLTVTFWGTKQVDVESVSSERYNYRSPQRQEKPDDGSCVASRGSEGFDITVTRVFKQLGTETVTRTEEFVTRYNAQPHVVCVPPAAPPGLRSPNDDPTARTHAAVRVHNFRRRRVKSAGRL